MHRVRVFGVTRRPKPATEHPRAGVAGGVAEGRRMIADLVRVGNLPLSESAGVEDSNIQAFRSRKQRLENVET